MKGIKEDRGIFGSNLWTQAVYDLRELILPNKPRNSAMAQKNLLFVILAAGVPSSTHPKAGYTNRLEILALKCGMQVKAIQSHLRQLEEFGLISKKSLGPNRPKLRYVNVSRLREVVERQESDFKAWYEANKDVDENDPPALWIPKEFYLEISNSKVTGSGTTLDTPLVTNIVAPLGAQVDSQLETTSLESKEMFDLPDCSPQHSWDEPCEECFHLEDRLPFKERQAAREKAICVELSLSPWL